jgi:phospholipid/cholesterol/gamma-HCH transport system ATP-binding protein
MDLKQQIALTTIIVTHDLNFALYLSDRVAMINADGIVEIGTPAEIKASQNPVVRGFIYTTTKGLKGD